MEDGHTLAGGLFGWLSFEPDRVESRQKDKREHCPDCRSPMRVYAKDPQKTENVSGMKASTADRAVRTTGLDL